MGREEIQPEQWAEIALERIVYEIERLRDTFTEQMPDEWVRSAVSILRWVKTAQKGLTVAEAYILACIQERWDDLPLQFRAQYYNNFNVFVFRELGRHPKTLSSDLRAVRIFLMEKAGPKLSVDVPVRDKYGNPVYEGGRVKTEPRQWNPLESSLGKLKTLVPYVEAGSVPPQAWSLALDPYANKKDLVDLLSNEGQHSGTQELILPSSIRFRLEGPVLVAERGGQEAVIAELDFTDFENDHLKQDAFRRLCELLSISDDTEAVLVMMHEAQLKRSYRDSR